MLDPATAEWRALPPPPDVPSGDLGVHALGCGGDGLVIVATPGGAPAPVLLTYDLADRAWSRRDLDLPEPRPTFTLRAGSPLLVSADPRTAIAVLDSRDGTVQRYRRPAIPVAEVVPLGGRVVAISDGGLVEPLEPVDT